MAVAYKSDIAPRYLSDIARFPLLTKSDEARLAREIEERRRACEQLRDISEELEPLRLHELRRVVARGEDVRQTFIQSNLRLVVSIAKKYQGSGLPLLDLIQEGNVGLIRAVEKFDWRKGFKFSTHATWWIRQAIMRAITNTGRTIRLPEHAYWNLARVREAQVSMELKLLRPATLAELGEEVGLPAEALRELLRFRAEPLSLSERLGADGDAEFGDVVEDRLAESPFDMAAAALLPIELSRLLSGLNERESEVLRLHYGLDGGEQRTLRQIADHLDMSHERIRQIELRAMLKLRHSSSRLRA